MSVPMLRDAAARVPPVLLAWRRSPDSTTSIGLVPSARRLAARILPDHAVLAGFANHGGHQLTQSRSKIGGAGS